MLGKLDDYRQAVVREWEADKPKEEDLKRRDSWRAIFMPQGTVRAN